MLRVVSIITFVMMVFLPQNLRADQPTAAFGSDAYTALGAYRGVVEEHISGVLHSLRIIAESSEAKSARIEKFKPLISRLSSDLKTDATSWYVFPDGRYFATEIGGMSEESLKDRAYFPALMSGKEVLGDLVISKSTGHRSVIIAVPVNIDGKVIGGVGVSLRVRLLSDVVGSYLGLPEREYFYALTRDSRIVLHRRAERMFKTPTDVGDEALGVEFQKILAKDRGTFNYTLNGKRIYSIFECSQVLAWCFFLAKEHGDV